MGLVYLLVLVLLFLSTFGAHILIMSVITATLIIMLESKESLLVEHPKQNVLLGILVLGFIMTSLLRVILLHNVH